MVSFRPQRAGPRAMRVEACAAARVGPTILDRLRRRDVTMAPDGIAALRFIGMISHRAQSETSPPAPGVTMDPGYVARFAQTHEAAGFDRILIAWQSTQPDAMLVAAHAAASTKIGRASCRERV